MAVSEKSPSFSTSLLLLSPLVPSHSLHLAALPSSPPSLETVGLKIKSKSAEPLQVTDLGLGRIRKPGAVRDLEIAAVTYWLLLHIRCGAELPGASDS